MIDNITGLCKTNGVGLQAYIHTDVIEIFVGWLNNNNSKIGGDNSDMSWETIALDDEARLVFKESENLCYLLIGRTRMGYAKSTEDQAFYQDLLNQAFCPALS